MLSARYMTHLTRLSSLLACAMLNCGLSDDDESNEDSDVRVSATRTDEGVPAYGLNFARFPRAGTHLGLLPDCPFDSADTFNEYATLGTNRVPYARVNFNLSFDQHLRVGDLDKMFSCLDKHMSEAAANAVYVLPIIGFSIEGSTRRYGAPYLPASPDDATVLSNLTTFAERLAMSYGPCGSFWGGNPSPLSIRAWEVLNEPNYQRFFSGNADDYRRILSAVREGLRKGDPRARIVLGGLSSIINPDVLNNNDTAFLRNVFKSPKDRCLVDAVAYHPYAHTHDVVKARTTAIVDVMKSNKLRLIDGPSSEDDAQLWITELGWGIADNLPPCSPEDPHCKDLKGSLVQNAEDQRDAIRSSASEVNKHRGEWRLGPTIWYVYTDEVALGGETGWASVAGVYKADARALDEPPRPAWETIGNFAGLKTSVPLPSVHSCGAKEAKAAEKRLRTCP